MGRSESKKPASGSSPNPKKSASDSNRSEQGGTKKGTRAGDRRFEEFLGPQSSAKRAAPQDLKGNSKGDSKNSSNRVPPQWPTFEEFSAGPPRQSAQGAIRSAASSRAASSQAVSKQAASKQSSASRTPSASKTPESRQAKVAEPSRSARSSSSTPPQPDPNSPYAEQTQRIRAWTTLVRTLQPVVWAVVILVVVIPLVGKLLLSNALPSPIQSSLKPLARPLTEITVQPIPRQSNLDQAMVAAIQSARTSAQGFAAAELADWESDLEPRVDHFLDWYFNYFNQKKLEFSTPLVWVSSAAIHTLDPNRMAPNEAVTVRFTEDFQREFAKQVLVPRNAQMQLELVTTDTINHYLRVLDQNIGEVQTKYHVPQGQWDRYLDDISTTIQDTEGNLSNLSLKMLVGGSGYLLTKPLVLATVGKIGGKMGSKLAGTAAAKLAAKTGGTVAAELGTGLVDPIVGVGIFIWDIWDYQHTVEVERPVLRANLLDYLQEVQHALLMDPETGVLSAIYQLEQGLFQAL